MLSRLDSRRDSRVARFSSSEIRPLATPYRDMTERKQTEMNTRLLVQEQAARQEAATARAQFLALFESTPGLYPHSHQGRAESGGLKGRAPHVLSAPRLPDHRSWRGIVLSAVPRLPRGDTKSLIPASKMARIKCSAGKMSARSSVQPSVSPGDTVQVGAGAPEPLRCRVSKLIRGVDGGWCQVRPVPECPFGLIFGHGLICQHPHCDKIVERTRNPPRAAL